MTSDDQMPEEPAPPPPAAPGAGAQTADEQAAEEALARLEDRIGAFTSYTLAADFLELHAIVAGMFERMKDEDWGRRTTDRRPQGWTIRQTLAHLEAVGSSYNAVIRDCLAGRPVEVPGLARREELKAFNAAAIEARAETPTDELCGAFLGSLEEAARLAAPLAAEQLGRLVDVPFFGSAATIAELFGASLCHAGIIHGAQISAVRSRPVWIFFPPGVMRRQLTRFFHTFGLAYWPERGGDLHATIGFDVTGQGGGSWYVRAHPAGGQGKIGRARTTDLKLGFASADLLCRVLTVQTAPWRHLLLRRITISGNLRLARRLPSLFTPT